MIRVLSQPGYCRYSIIIRHAVHRVLSDKVKNNEPMEIHCLTSINLSRILVLT